MTQRRCKDCAAEMIEWELDGQPVWRCTGCWRIDPREVVAEETDPEAPTEPAANTPQP